jgi:hypothetical protein
LQQAQQNPALIEQLRSRLQASGLTSEQIRARLAASGYPADLLDAYLGPAQAGQATPTPGAEQMAAIQALGLGTIALASDSMQIDTGMIRMRQGVSAESLAAGNYVFGWTCSAVPPRSSCRRSRGPCRPTTGSVRAITWCSS